MIEIEHREGPAPPRRTTPVPYATKNSCPWCGLVAVRGGHQCRFCGTWRPREKELPRSLWRRKGGEELTGPEEPTEHKAGLFMSDFECTDEY